MANKMLTLNDSITAEMISQLQRDVAKASDDAFGGLGLRGVVEKYLLRPFDTESGISISAAAGNRMDNGFGPGSQGMANMANPYSAASQQRNNSLAPYMEYRIGELQGVFGNQRPFAESVTAVATLPAPQEPTTQLPQAPDAAQRQFLTDYQKLAQKIGYRCVEAERELVENELEAFLHENGMAVYDYQAVTRYLDATVERMTKTLRERHAWRWVPLRQCDKGQVVAQLSTGMVTYTKPIPYPVLLTIEKVHERFGERLAMFVSDIYTVPKADPFLGVSAPGSERLFVIERWDEPGFRS